MKIRSQPYGFDYEELGEHSIGFRCSTDAEAWPWLALSPHHPLVIQTQNFWASHGAITFAREMEAGQWSALTWTDWRCGAPRGEDAGHAVRGVYDRVKAADGPAYSLKLFDANDRLLVTTRGRGVVFRNRDFETWRQTSKDKAQAVRPSRPFAYAAPEALGLSHGERPLIAPLLPDADRIEALVTVENGFRPGNRMIGGSGDHVNTTHFGEIARQALCLITGDPAVQVTGGEMTLRRYVELGAPFALVIQERQARSAVFALEQMGHSCASLIVRW